MHKRIDLLVVEDEESTCREYEKKCEEYEDIFLIGTAQNSSDGVKMVEKYHPNAIVLDLEFHNGGGNGLIFLEQINKLELPQKPFVLVSTNNISQITHSIARNRGADFVVTKNQLDYSVDMVLGLLQGINSSIPNMGDGISSDSPAAKLRAEQEYGRKIASNIIKELDLVGISPKLKGRIYLKDAIELVIKHRQVDHLTRVLAEMHKKTEPSVERAMQNAINYAWRNTDIDTLSKYYDTYVNPKRGVPTVTEFIYYYAEKVKNSV